MPCAPWLKAQVAEAIAAEGFRVFELPSGFRLLVGRDLEERERLYQSIAESSRNLNFPIEGLSASLTTAALAPT